MTDVDDYKVVVDEKVNAEPWFIPSGLSATIKVKRQVRVFDLLNLRRTLHILWDSRQPLADSKISRRSRRRWRGRGGVWQFDPHLMTLFQEALFKVKGR